MLLRLHYTPENGWYTQRYMNLTRRAFGKAAAASLPGSLWGNLRAAVRPYPKLLILFVSEQFRPEYLDRADRTLGPGGFKRLMEKGAYFPDCRCEAEHLHRQLAGHPGDGLLAGRARNRRRHLVRPRREEHRGGRPGGPARRHPGGAVCRRLPDARVFLCGSDERWVDLFRGQAPAKVFYMSPDGPFTTRGEAPAWFTEYNRLHPMENVHDAKWVALGAGAGVPPLRTLSYDSAHPSQFFMLYRVLAVRAGGAVRTGAGDDRAGAAGPGRGARSAGGSAGRDGLAGLRDGRRFAPDGPDGAAPRPRDGTHPGRAQQDARRRQLRAGFHRRARGPAGSRARPPRAHGGAGRGPGARGGAALGGALRHGGLQVALRREVRVPVPLPAARSAARRNAREVRVEAARAALADPAVAGYYTAGRRLLPSRRLGAALPQQLPLPRAPAT